MSDIRTRHRACVCFESTSFSRARGRERTMPGRGCIGSNSCRATITVNTPSVCFVLSRRNFTRRGRDENCSPVLRKSAPPFAPRFEQLRIKAREKVASPRVEVKSVQSVCVYAWNLNICSSFSPRPPAINDGNLKGLTLIKNYIVYKSNRNIK